MCVEGRGGHVRATPVYGPEYKHWNIIINLIKEEETVRKSGNRSKQTG